MASSHNPSMDEIPWESDHMVREDAICDESLETCCCPPDGRHVGLLQMEGEGRLAVTCDSSSS